MSYNNTNNGEDTKKDDNLETGVEMGVEDGEKINKEKKYDNSKSTGDEKNDK